MHKKLFCQLAGLTAILVCGLINWRHLGIITIVGDEFGYWGAGAQFAGFSWENLLSHSFYYAYGYGLIVSVLFRIGLSAGAMVKAAVLLNLLMLLACYGMAQYVGHTVFPELSGEIVAIAASAVILFSNNVFQVYMGAPEVLMYFLFWCIAVCAMHLMIRRRARDVAGIVFATVYLYAVHSRSLGVVLTVFCFLVCMAVVCRKERGAAVLWTGLAVLILALGISQGVRDYTIVEWYQNNSSVAVNDYGGQVGKIRALFSLKGIIQLGASIASKFWAQGVGSLLLSFFPFTFCLGEVVRRLRGDKTAPDLHTRLSFFILLCYLSEILVSAVYKSGSPRSVALGSITMSRYMDFVLGPVLMLTLCRLAAKGVEKWEICLAALFFALCTGATAVQAGMARSLSVIYFNNMDTVFWYKILPKGIAGIVLTGVCVLALGMVYGLLIRSRRAYVCATVAIGLFWGMAGVWVSGEYISSKKAEAEQYLWPIVDITEEAGEDAGVVYFYDAQDAVTGMEWLKLLQFVKPGMSICAVPLETADSYDPPGNCLIMSGITDSTREYLSERYELIYNGDRMCVYLPNAEQQEEK